MFSHLMFLLQAVAFSIPGFLVGPIIGIALPFIGSIVVSLLVAYVARAQAWDASLNPTAQQAVNVAIATLLSVIFGALGSGVIPAAATTCVQTATAPLSCLDAATINKVVTWALSFLAAHVTSSSLHLAKLRRQQLNMRPGIFG